MTQVTQPPRWKDIVSNPRFQQMDQAGRLKAANKYFEQFVDGEAYRGLPDDQQELVRERLYSEAGVSPIEIGAFENFLNAGFNAIGPERYASILDLFGEFESAEAARASGRRPTVPSVSSALGGVAGEVAPFAAALGISATGAGAVVGAPLLVMLMAESGARQAGGARRLVREYERETGETVSAGGEAALATGFGLTALIAQGATSLAAKGILKGAGPQLINSLKTITTKPTAAMKALGEKYAIGDIPGMAKIVGQMAGVNALDESVEQVLQNIMASFIDPRTGALDDLAESALLGAAGGGMIGSSLRGQHYLSRIDVARFVKGRNLQKGEIEGVTEEVQAAIDAEDPQALSEALDKAAEASLDEPVVPLNPDDDINVPAFEAAQSQLLKAAGEYRGIVRRGGTPDKTRVKYEEAREQVQQVWNAMFPEDKAGARFQQWLDESGFDEIEADLLDPVQSLPPVEKEVVELAEGTSPVISEQSPVKDAVVEQAIEEDFEAQIDAIRDRVEGENATPPTTFNGHEIEYVGEIKGDFVPAQEISRFLVGLQYAQNNYSDIMSSFSKLYFVSDEAWTNENLNRIEQVEGSTSGISEETLRAAGYYNFGSHIVVREGFETVNVKDGEGSRTVRRRILSDQEDDLDFSGRSTAIKDIPAHRLGPTDYAGTIVHEATHAYRFSSGQFRPVTGGQFSRLKEETIADEAQTSAVIDIAQNAPPNFFFQRRRREGDQILTPEELASLNQSVVNLQAEDATRIASIRDTVKNQEDLPNRFEGKNINYIGNVKKSEAERFLVSLYFANKRGIGRKYLNNIDNIYLVDDSYDESAAAEEITEYPAPLIVFTQDRDISRNKRTLAYLENIVSESAYITQALIDPESQEASNRAFRIATAARNTAKRSAPTNFFFQSRAVRRPASLLQLHRLVAPLQDSGLVKSFRQARGTLMDEAGEPVNAILDRRTGVVWLSESVELSTVGHEAAHRLMDILGTDDPLVTRGLEIYDGNTEALSEAIGEFYAGRELAEGKTQRLANWLSDLWVAVKNRLGVEPTQNDVIALLNGKLTEPQAPEVTPPLESRRRQATDKDNNEYIRGINLRKIEIAEIGQELQSDVEFLERVIHDETEFDPTSNIEEQRQRALALVAKEGDEGMERIARRYKSGKGRTTLDERVALRLWGDSRSLDLLTQVLALGDLRTTQYQDVREALFDEAARIRREITYPLSHEAGAGLGTYKIASRPGELLWKHIEKLAPLLSKKQIEFIGGLIKDNSIRDPRVLKRVLETIKPSSAKDRVWSLYLNNILSNPTTHMVNLSNNALWLAWELGVTRPLEAGIGLFLPTPKKSQRQTLLREVIPSITGLAPSVGHATRSALSVLTKGPLQSVQFIEDTKLGMDLTGFVGAWARSTKPWQRAVAPLIEFPGNALIAADVWFKTLAFDAFMQGEASRLRLEGAERTNFLQAPDKESVQAAENFARRVTFTDRPGKIIAGAQRIRENTPFGIGIAVVPFMNTLTNIFKRAAEITPGLGLAVSRDQPLARTLAQQVQGAFLTWLLVEMFEDDELTDAVPLDSNERSLFYASGRIPYSFKVGLPEGDYWISYQRAEPFNTVFALISAYRRAAREVQLERDSRVSLSDEPQLRELTSMFQKVSGSVISAMIESTWTSGLTGYLGSHGLQSRALSFPGRTASSFIPYSGMLKAFSRGLQAETEGERRLSEYVPNLSEIANTLPWSPEKTFEFFGKESRQRIDIFGEEVAVDGGLLRQWLPVKYQESLPADSIEEELIRLDYYPRLPRKTVSLPRYGDVEIPEDMYFEYALAYGKATKEGVSRVLQSRRYQRAEDQTRRTLLEKVLPQARARVNQTLRREVLRALRSADRVGSRIGRQSRVASP